MKKLPFFLLPILVLELTISVDSQNPALLQFVLQWPPTFCMTINSGTPQARCKEPIPQHSLTLHGVWPADQNGRSLTCTQPPDPDWNQLFTQNRARQLSKFWLTLRENAQNQDLWKNEWRRHGACGGTSAEVYFDTAIMINNMIREGNLFNYLKTSGIIACDSLSFTKREIVEAIQKVFVVPPPPSPPPSRPPPPPPPPLSPPPPPPALNVYLTCIPIDPTNGTHIYLREVTLCTNLAGTSFISCPPGAAPRSCSTGPKIMLPHPKPQSTRIFQDEVDVTYPTFEKSRAKYIFNG